MDAYNKSLNSVVESYNSIEAASNRAIKNLQNESQMRKELTKLHGAPESAIADIDQKERRDEIEEKKKLRSKLANDSSDNLKKAQDIHVATQEEDNKNLADAKAQAGEAKKRARRQTNDWRTFKNYTGRTPMPIRSIPSIITCATVTALPLPKPRLSSSGLSIMRMSSSRNIKKCRLRNRSGKHCAPVEAAAHDGRRQGAG